MRDSTSCTNCLRDKFRDGLAECVASVASKASCAASAVVFTAPLKPLVDAFPLTAFFTLPFGEAILVAVDVETGPAWDDATEDPIVDALRVTCPFVGSSHPLSMAALSRSLSAAFSFLPFRFFSPFPCFVCFSLKIDGLLRARVSEKSSSTNALSPRSPSAGVEV